MKVTRNQLSSLGKRSVNLTLNPGESAVITSDGAVKAYPFHVGVMPIDSNLHYRLGGQVGDIVAPHVITEAEGVYWCSIEQNWIAR